MAQAEHVGGFYGFLESIQAMPFAEVIRTSIWWFPVIETIHVLAIVFVLGSIAIVDLRLIGAISRSRPITHVSAEMLPWTWVSFAIAAISGTALFTAQAVRYVDTIYFVLKMVIMLAAGLNMLYFEYVTKKNAAQWDREARPPANVRFAGATSLILWLGVVTTGRFIGFI
nr:MAG: hypothetical protein E4H34_02865 [Hyphomicrobiales bacterium]